MIPVRDGLPYVLDAVSSALDQVEVLTRVIVVDDGSSDGTPAAIRNLESPRVSVISGQPHESTCAARNRGIAASSATWLTFLDSDDLWPANRTTRLLGAITDSTIDLAVGQVVDFVDEAPATVSPPSSMRRPALCVGGTLSSRELFDAVGPFDERLRVGEYVDWLSRARDRGVREVVVPTIALYRRKHSGNTSKARRGDYGPDVMTIVRHHQQRTRS